VIGLARKTHNTGTRARHSTKEAHDQINHSNKRKQQLLKQAIRKQKKKGKRLVSIIKRISAPELLKQWVRVEKAKAREQLNGRKIRQFTFYCKLLAIDAIYAKRMPKRAVRIKKGVVFRPSKGGLLSKAQKRDMVEKLNAMETGVLKRKQQVKKQAEKLEKTLPKALPGVA